MSDIVPYDKRRQMMAGISSKNTAPEILIRKALHNAGFRYRLHIAELPGTPDLVFPKYRAVINVNGCFWHGHNCHLFRWPSTRFEFWHQKITDTIRRDSKNNALLLEIDWRVLTIWECALRGKQRLSFDELTDRVIKWLTSDTTCLEITGTASDDFVEHGSVRFVPVVSPDGNYHG